ncbi:MAG TPA: glycosyltransferase family 39 protein, partial [Phycisphaerales bacterium]|nr:glycosyltransferase family 39 protein [Phycisphaerales bacterium]
MTDAANRADGPTRLGSSGFARWVVGVVLLAVALRAAYLFEIKDMGFWRVALGDAAIYVHRATGIASGDWAGPADFVHAPLYAYVMALPRMVGLTELVWVRVMQMAMSAASLALLMVVTRRLFGSRAGVIAGVLYAVLPSAIYFDGLIEKSSLAVLLTMGVIACAINAQGENVQGLNQKIRGGGAWDWARWLVAGALLGLLVLTRQNALALLPLVIVGVAVSRSQTQRAQSTDQKGSAAMPRLLAVGAVLIGFALAVSPWVARNKMVTDEFVLSTPNMGQNFWMGNDPRSTGTYMSFQRGKVNPEHEQAEWVKEAEAATGHPMSAKEVSDWYFARGMKFVREQP